ncbi:MAG: hypothetical protein JW828_00100 [Sedimentisphaerales bacterium]|nr:hypothetical protein [Sedimentisphaerales bacterium]
MKYGMVINPASGPLTRKAKGALVEKLKSILGHDCRITGLDTQTKHQLVEAARDLAGQASILILAGGDGTFSQILNALGTDPTYALLPIGSANALARTLGLSKKPLRAIRQIQEGQVRTMDLVCCDGSRLGVLTAVGIEADILCRRDRLLARGFRGAVPYFIATAQSIRYYQRTDITLRLDGQVRQIPRAVSVIVSKIPSYGFGLNLIPQAQVDDGMLHILTGNVGKLHLAWALLKSFVVPNRTGLYLHGTRLVLETAQPRWLQTEGELYRQGTLFTFEALPGALKIIQ